MQRSSLAVCLALLVAGSVPMSAQPVNQDPSVLEFEISRLTIDLVNHTGEDVRITAKVHEGAGDAAEFGDEVRSVTAHFLHVDSDAKFARSLGHPISGGWDRLTWSLDLPVDEPRLLTGRWSVHLEAVDAEGGEHDSRSTGLVHDLIVVAPEVEFALGIIGKAAPDQGSAYPPHRAAFGDTIRMQATLGPGGTYPFMLHRMEAVIVPPSGAVVELDPLPFPHVISVGDWIEEGQSLLSVTAFDRTGEVRTLTMPIVKDTFQPFSTFVAPDLTYQTVPFTVHVAVADDHNHTVFANLDGDKRTSVSTSPVQLHNLTFTRDRIGTVPLFLRFVDELGNENSTVIPITTVAQVSDISLADVRLVQEDLLPTDIVSIVAVVEQGKEGMGDVPFNVTFTPPTGYGLPVRVNDTVAPNATTGVLYNDFLAPGRHVVNVTLEPDARLNETDITGHSFELEFDVWLGRVLFGDAVYHIRANAVGLPLEAVDAENNTYALRLSNDGATQVYAFTVGEDEMHWNPHRTVTTIQPESHDDHDDEEDSPGLGLIVAAGAVLAVAAIGRRRE